MKLIKIGKVLKPHGYKGSFTVSTNDKNSALRTATQIFIGPSEKDAKPYSITNAAWMPKAWKITVQEITSEEQVDALREQLAFLTRETLPETKKNEYYLSDLMGLDGIDTETLKAIGQFFNLEEIGIPGTTICQHTWCFKSGEKELRVPAVPHFVSSVDLKAKKIFLKNLKELQEDEE